MPLAEALLLVSTPPAAATTATRESWQWYLNLDAADDGGDTDQNHQNDIAKLDVRHQGQGQRQGGEGGGRQRSLFSREAHYSPALRPFRSSLPLPAFLTPLSKDDRQHAHGSSSNTNTQPDRPPQKRNGQAGPIENEDGRMARASLSSVNLWLGQSQSPGMMHHSNALPASEFATADADALGVIGATARTNDGGTALPSTGLSTSTSTSPFTSSQMHFDTLDSV